MQPAVERRADRVARMDFDAVVELHHGDFAAPFEADALDLGPGGIALQAPYLPAIGTHLDCRFALPGTDQDVAVSGEVVWAASRGPDAGRFGLRFQHLQGELRDRLRRTLGDTPEPQLGDDGDDDEVREVRLALEGVDSPIVARPVHRAPDLLVVEQPLPFLSLGRGVRVGEEARGARLDSVDLVQGAGDVPRLVLTLSWTEDALATVDDPGADPADAADSLEAFVQEDFADGTYPGAVGPESDGLVAPPGPVDGDPTEPDLAPPQVEDAAADRVARAPAPTPEPGDASPTAATPGPRRILRDDSGAEWRVPAPGTSHRRRAVVAAAREAAQDTARRARAAVAGALPPVLRVGREALRLGRRILRALARVFARPATPAPRGPATRNVRARTDAEPGLVLDRQRLLLGALVALAAGAAAVFVFRGGDGAAADASPTSLAAAAAAEDAPYAPSLAELGAATAPAEDEAAPAPEAAAPDAVPDESPYAVDLQELAEGPSAAPAVFGDPHVPNGQSFLLRMSQPVRSLEGRVEEDGFSVTMRGTLALQGAAPIAAAHPAVERALILNRGSYSVLTVRFADGKKPAYRVVARNQALEIEIGD